MRGMTVVPEVPRKLINALRGSTSLASSHDLISLLVVLPLVLCSDPRRCWAASTGRKKIFP